MSEEELVELEDIIYETKLSAFPTYWTKEKAELAEKVINELKQEKEKNKELEEETRKPLKVCIGRRNYGKTCEIRTFIEEDYIPKSKVREKIEEAENKLNDIKTNGGKEIMKTVINLLQELLQEGDDKEDGKI